MRISKYKFKRREDKVVFKILMRCLKEDDRLYYLRHNRNGISITFGTIIGLCYKSRENHPDEPFQANIFYWPDDCGCLFKSNITKFIYVALLINNLKIKTDFLKGRYAELFISICNNPNLFLNFNANIFSFYDIIKNAFIKCGNSENEAETKTRTVEMILIGAKNEIPF